MPYQEILNASPGAVLGVIAVAVVAALVTLVLRKRNGNGGNGNGHQAAPSVPELPRNVMEQVHAGIAFVEEHNVPIPENWRDLPFTVKQLEAIDRRILHKRRSDAMQFGILARLIRGGHNEEAARLLEAMEHDAKDAVSSHGGSS